MKNNKKIFLLGISIPIVISFYPLIVSCSNDYTNKVKEANEIYSKIMTEVSGKEIGNPKSYVQNIYDLESFKINSKNSLINSIDQSKYIIELIDINYNKAKEGILEFRILIKDKKDEKKLNTMDSIITIKGYNKISSDEYEKILSSYNDLSNKEIKFNEQGKKWIKNNFSNIKENIYFDKSKSSELGYIGNLLDIPSFLNDNEVIVHSFKTNIFNQNPIIIKEYGIDFNFWILLTLKNNPEQPFCLPFSLSTIIKNTIPLRVIKYIK